MMRPPRLCSCGNIVPADQRCACQITADRARKARHDRRRPSARQRGYTSEWQKARAAFLRMFPYCRHNGCGRPATIVHHVIPHKGDQRLFWDRGNWLACCKSCHDGPLQRAERGR
ncbi:HNH endonuclease signature motif containing protein [Mesorhizobium sp. YIM 152430]|nr:HNH endonuclease signature motif containing protein [Mesorhizobium sp. YIM 152430]MDF1600169.1 HNH endonuclease signature motif containing protein [Mesorhizobium sp. YIM 152430]